MLYHDWGFRGERYLAAPKTGTIRRQNSRCTCTCGPPKPPPAARIFLFLCACSAPDTWSGSTESSGVPRREYTVTGRQPPGPASRTSASVGPCRPPSKCPRSCVSSYVSGHVVSMPLWPTIAVLILTSAVSTYLVGRFLAFVALVLGDRRFSPASASPRRSSFFVPPRRPDFMLGASGKRNMEAFGGRGSAVRVAGALGSSARVTQHKRRY